MHHDLKTRGSDLRTSRTMSVNAALAVSGGTATDTALTLIGTDAAASFFLVLFLLRKKKKNIHRLGISYRTNITEKYRLITFLAKIASYLARRVERTRGDCFVAIAPRNDGVVYCLDRIVC
jgi:LPXTG-motif cell wall-anchored protein